MTKNDTKIRILRKVPKNDPKNPQKRGFAAPPQRKNPEKHPFP